MNEGADSTSLYADDFENSTISYSDNSDQSFSSYTTQNSNRIIVDHDGNKFQLLQSNEMGNLYFMTLSTNMRLFWCTSILKIAFYLTGTLYFILVLYKSADEFQFSYKFK